MCDTSVMEEHRGNTSKIAPKIISHDRSQGYEKANNEAYCPACGSPLVQEKCKMVCRSSECVYRIIFNCSEF